MTLYREAECEHDGWRATVSGHPQCLDCGGLLLYVVPVEPDYEADAEAIYSYLEATNMQGASFFPWANTAKRRWINAYKAALAEKVSPDVRAWHTVFMQALYGGADKNTAYDAVLDAALGVGEETP